MIGSSGQLAGLLGKILQQSYEMHEGQWWLFTLGKPERPLEKTEVKWHTERNHYPFVENGITDTTSEEWWADPF